MSAYVTPLIQSKRHDILAGSTKKFRNLKKQGLSSSTIGSGKIWYKSYPYFFSFSHFNSKKNSIHNVTIYNYDRAHKLKNISKVNSLTYSFDTKKWTPKGYTDYTNLNIPSFPIVINKSQPIKLNEDISDFKQIEADITTLSFFKLYNYISQLNETGINVGEYLVIFYKHISDSIICVIFALLAAIPIFNPK